VQVMGVYSKLSTDSNSDSNHHGQISNLTDFRSAPSDGKKVCRQWARSHYRAKSKKFYNFSQAKSWEFNFSVHTCKFSNFRFFINKRVFQALISANED
jgi:hypothetical protein